MLRLVRRALRGSAGVPSVAPVALAALVALTAAVAAVAENVRPTDIVAVDDFIDAARAVFGRNRGEVERTLGAPTQIRARTLADGVSAAEAVDELIYPGVAIFVSRRSSAVRRVVLSEARGALPRGLTVGTARDEIERALGEPQATSDASVMYLYNDGFPNTVEFHFRQGRVRQIEWTFAASD